MCSWAAALFVINYKEHLQELFGPQITANVTQVHKASVNKLWQGDEREGTPRAFMVAQAQGGIQCWRFSVSPEDSTL